MARNSTMLVSLLAVGLLIVAGAAVIIGQEGPGGNGDETVTVTDMFDREVIVPSDIDKVVVVGGVLNHMNWLQATDLVVGVEEIETRADSQTGSRVYRWANPDYKDLPNIGPAAQPNAEMISTVEPDVVFFASLTVEAVNTLQSQMPLIPVVGLNYPEFGANHDGFFEQLRLVAQIIDREQRAEDLIDWIETTLADLQERGDISSGPDPDVYVGSILQGPGGTGLTSTMPFYPPFTMITANNVIDPAEDAWFATQGSLGRYTVDIEFIVTKDPSYMFLDYAGLAASKVQYTNNKATLDNVRAIDDGNVYGVLPWHSYNNNIETMFINAYFIGKIIYPDQFTDVDPVAFATQTYEFWYGTSVYYDLTTAVGGGLGPIDLDA